MWSYFKHKTQTQLLFHFSLLLKCPEHSHSPSHPNIQTRNPHSTEDKHISSVAENSHLLSSVTSHSKPHSTLSLSCTEVSSKTQLLSFYINSQTFGSSPIFYHYSHLAVLVEIKSCRLEISDISRRKSSLKDSVLLCRTQIFKTRDLYSIIVSYSTSRKRVFKPRVLYGTRVSKTRNASLQLSFKCLLTYYIISIYYASPQISP